MKYTVDYFIEKFTAIPDELWTTNTYTRPVNYQNQVIDAHCALGHCGVTVNNTVESTCLTDLFRVIRTFASVVNDGENPAYRQPTPKARILAALHDIKTKQQ